jgi:hypothetical protein
MNNLHNEIKILYDKLGNTQNTLSEKEEKLIVLEKENSLLKNSETDYLEKIKKSQEDKIKSESSFKKLQEDQEKKIVDLNKKNKNLLKRLEELTNNCQLLDQENNSLNTKIQDFIIEKEKLYNEITDFKINSKNDLLLKENEYERNTSEIENKIREKENEHNEKIKKYIADKEAQIEDVRNKYESKILNINKNNNKAMKKKEDEFLKLIEENKNMNVKFEKDEEEIMELKTEIQNNIENYNNTIMKLNDDLQKEINRNKSNVPINDFITKDKYNQTISRKDEIIQNHKKEIEMLNKKLVDVNENYNALNTKMKVI